MPHLVEYTYNIIFISLAVYSICFTITKSSLFDFVRDYFLLSTSIFYNRIGELLSCPYCLSHWIALSAILLYGINYSITEVFLKVFVVVSLVSFIRIFEK